MTARRHTMISRSLKCAPLRRLTTNFVLFVLAGFGALLMAESAEAITRVRPVAEVGKHIFQIEGGVAGSFEELSGGESSAWALGWSYHADRSLGIGISIGRNKPENEVFKFDTFTGSFDYVTVDIHVRAPNRSAFVPRVLAGFGYYNIELVRFQIPENRLLTFDEGQFGMRFGAGLDVLAGDQFSIGVVATYHYISLDQPDFFTEASAVDGLGNWYDTWDIKAVVSFYTH